MTETTRKLKKKTDMSPRSAKDLRHYVGAAGIFLLIVFLLLFLSYNEIPPVNKDVFVSVVGMMVGSLSVVMYTIIGKNPEELESLRNKNESLQGSMDMMEIRNDQLESMIIQIQQNIIKNLTVLDDIDTSACECGKEKCDCKKQKQSEDKSLKGYGQTIQNKKPLRRLESLAFKN